MMNMKGDIRKEYDPNKFFVIVMATRPGGQLFCTKLEYGHYPPRTAKNDDFGLNITTWQGLVFYVVSVPLKDRAICDAVANSIGMKIANGVPTMIDSSGSVSFPLSGDNVWTLEGKYQGDEMAAVQKVFADDNNQMLSDFQSMTEIKLGKPKDLDEFMADAVTFNSYSPIMAILFGNENRKCVDECFLAYIQGKAFACCTISRKEPAIVGLYVIPRARKLGIGTRLFKAALQHCIDKKLTPVRVDVSSDVVMQIIKKLPSEMGQHLKIKVAKYDLTALEEPYVLNKGWWVNELKEENWIDLE